VHIPPKDFARSILIGSSFGFFLFLMFLVGLLTTHSFIVGVGCVSFAIASFMFIWLSYKVFRKPNRFLNKPALVVTHLGTLALFSLLASWYFVIPSFY